jgi:hypothetical protein
MTAQTWERAQLVVTIGAYVAAGVIVWYTGWPRGALPALAVLFVSFAAISWLNLRFGVVRRRQLGMAAAVLQTVAAVGVLVGLALTWR